jgi:TatD DNase family protein
MLWYNLFIEKNGDYMLIDTHCHLLNEYYDNVQEIIDKMQRNNIIGFVSGTDVKNSEEAVSLANKNENIYATVGFHPTELNHISENDWITLEKMMKHPKVVAVGEIGLDYYHSIEQVKEQKKAFIRQIRLAKKYNKPIIIHNREATDDILKILYKENVSLIGGIMHCFNGNLETAKKIIDLNLLISVGGIVTFSNADDLRQVIKNIDLEYIVLETDSPFLAPTPFRGKKNDPTLLENIVNNIANVKDISNNQVKLITTKNVCKMFKIGI